jgi:hypothetical protein
MSSPWDKRGHQQGSNSSSITTRGWQQHRSGDLITAVLIVGFVCGQLADYAACVATCFLLPAAIVRDTSCLVESRGSVGMVGKLKHPPLAPA